MSEPIGKRLVRPVKLEPPYEIRTDPDTGETWAERFALVEVERDTEAQVEPEPTDSK